MDQWSGMLKRPRVAWDQALFPHCSMNFTNVYGILGREDDEWKSGIELGYRWNDLKILNWLSVNRSD